MAPGQAELSCTRPLAGAPRQACQPPRPISEGKRWGSRLSCWLCQARTRMIPVTEATLILGLRPLTARKLLLLGEERVCPCSREFLLERLFWSAHLGSCFLAPVRVEKGGNQEGEREGCRNEFTHAFIPPTNISLAQLPTGPRLGLEFTDGLWSSFCFQRASGVWGDGCVNRPIQSPR